MKMLIFCILMILSISIASYAQDPRNVRVWVPRAGKWVAVEVATDYAKEYMQRRSALMQAAQAAEVQSQRQLEAARQREESAWGQFQSARQRNPYDPNSARLYNAAMRASWLRANAEINRNLVRERNVWTLPIYDASTRGQRSRQAPVTQTQTRQPQNTDRWERAPIANSRAFEPRSLQGSGWDLVAPRLEVDRRMSDPRPLSGGKTVDTFSKERPQYRDTFTLPDNRGGRTVRGTRDDAPTRDTPAKETRSYRDDYMDRVNRIH